MRAYFTFSVKKFNIILIRWVSSKQSSLNIELTELKYLKKWSLNDFYLNIYLLWILLYYAKDDFTYKTNDRKQISNWTDIVDKKLSFPCYFTSNIQLFKLEEPLEFEAIMQLQISRVVFIYNKNTWMFRKVVGLLVEILE